MNNLTVPSPAGSRSRFAANSLLAPAPTHRPLRAPILASPSAAASTFAPVIAVLALVWSALADELGA